MNNGTIIQNSKTGRDNYYAPHLGATHRILHSFTCYQGKWQAPDGFQTITAYLWIARATCAFTVQAFVFISGYLYAFQRITLNRTVTFQHLFIQKFKRLILPNFIFGLFYFLLF